MASDDPATGVTIRTVAQHAGVSPATVSRVLRGTAKVSTATEERVRAAILELGFRPSRLGVALAERRHAANGIVFPDLSGPYFAEVILGYEEVAAELGHSVLILSTRGRTDPERAVRDLADRVDGLLVFGRTVDDPALTDIMASGVPVVLMARPAIAGADNVTADNEDSARALAEHLVALGKNDIAYLGSPEDSSDTAQRWSALEQVLTSHGLPLRTPVPCGFGVADGRTRAKEVLGGASAPDALVCVNDEVALGAMEAAEELGLTVGTDLAITGWDDIMAARHARPALTTVRQPMRELGAAAAR
ncbi:LacI family DNA-binding transcriptional regulator, partial [Nocardiopsis nanhaiensis]